MKLRPLCSKTDGLLSIWKNVSVNRRELRREMSVMFWKKKKPEGPTVIVPGNCRDIPNPIMTPECCVAVVIGGSNRGFGFTAAEQLLANGAKRVVLADNEPTFGVEAVERLCKAFGRERAKFYPCDLQNSCQIEGIFTSSYCKDEVVSFVFNDLDAIQQQPEAPAPYCKDVIKVSNVQRLSRLALEHMMAKGGGKRPGLIVNCASILGFMGWPNEPLPVYCGTEPVNETTIRLAKEHPTDKSNVRFVALLPSNRSFEAISLPIDPKSANCLTDPKTCERITCMPDPMQDRIRMGWALMHLMAIAKTGSAWFHHPPFSLRVKPQRLKLDEGPINLASHLDEKKKKEQIAEKPKLQRKSTCQCL